MMKRHNGSAWVDLQFARRHNGSAWVDLQFARRHNGSSWVDIWPMEQTNQNPSDWTSFGDFIRFVAWSNTNCMDERNIVNMDDNGIQMYAVPTAYNDTPATTTQAGVLFNKAIDFTNYTKMEVTIQVSLTYFNEKASFHNTAYILLLNNKPSDFTYSPPHMGLITNGTSGGYDILRYSNVRHTDSGGNCSLKGIAVTSTIDVSGISGNKYIAVYSQSAWGRTSGGSSTGFYLKKIRLYKE